VTATTNLAGLAAEPVGVLGMLAAWAAGAIIGGGLLLSLRDA